MIASCGHNIKNPQCHICFIKLEEVKMSGCHVPHSETSQSLAEVLHDLKLMVIDVQKRLDKLEDEKHLKKIHCSFCGKTSLVKL